MSIRKFAVSDTAVLHLLDAGGSPMFAGQEEDGTPSKPIELVLYSPGSKEFAAAEKSRSDALMSMVKKEKGRNKALSLEDAQALKVDFLVACTASANNLELDGQQGRDLYRAVYSDRSLGFITDQVDNFVGNWGNFSPKSVTS